MNDVILVRCQNLVALFVDDGRTAWRGTDPRPLHTAIWYRIDDATQRETARRPPAQTAFKRLTRRDLVLNASKQSRDLEWCDPTPNGGSRSTEP